MTQGQQNIDFKLLSKVIDRNLALICFNIDHKVVYVNSNFASALSYTEDELIGMDHSAFCFPSFSKSPQYQTFWDDLLNGKSYQDKIERKSKQNQSVWLEATYMPIIDENDKQVIGVLKVATDITQREERIRTFAEQLKNMAEELSTQSNEGNNNNDILIKEIETIESHSNNNADQLSELQRQASQINGIVDVVKQISDQTNILAINAAIEGAHAGDKGRGFVVVARELQNLSDRVKKSIIEVERQASLIISGVDKISEGTRTVQTNVHESRKSIESAVHSFQDIAAAAEELDKHSNDFDAIL